MRDMRDTARVLALVVLALFLFGCSRGVHGPRLPTAPPDVLPVPRLQARDSLFMCPDGSVQHQRGTCPPYCAPQQGTEAQGPCS